MNAAFEFYSYALNNLLTIEKKKGKELTKVRELNMVIQGSYPQLRSFIDAEYCCSVMLRSLILKININ